MDVSEAFITYHKKQLDDDVMAVWYAVGNVIYLEFRPTDNLFGFWN